MTRYVSCADTAKLLRQALKARFPGIKFSVRSHSYSGGASIDVRWMDGPNVASVEATAKLYQGATFDGMTDMKEYHHSVLVSGETMEEVHFGADFVFCNRDHSEGFLFSLEGDAHPLSSSTWTNCNGSGPGCRNGFGGEHGSGWIIPLEGDASCKNAGCSPACAARSVARQVNA